MGNTGVEGGSTVKASWSSSTSLTDIPSACGSTCTPPPRHERENQRASERGRGRGRGRDIESIRTAPAARRSTDTRCPCGGHASEWVRGRVIARSL